MLLIGQSLECWRVPLAGAVARRDSRPLLGRARRQLKAGVAALDVNFGAGPRPGLAEDMRWTAETLREALPAAPLFLDCGDLDVLASVTLAVAPPLVVNAVPLDSTASASRLRLLEAAAAAGAGVVFSPRVNDDWDDQSAIMAAAKDTLALAARADLHGPLYLDCLAYPAVSHATLCRRSLAWLRALRAAGETRLVPLVAVGNVGHGAAEITRAAIHHVYVALALQSGAQALIIPAEDSSLMSLVKVMTTGCQPESAAERWLLQAMRPVGGHPRRLPPPEGSDLRAAWELLA